MHDILFLSKPQHWCPIGLLSMHRTLYNQLLIFPNELIGVKVIPQKMTAMDQSANKASL